MGIGKSKENISPGKLKIKIGDFLIVENGQASEELSLKEKSLQEYMKWDSINVEIDLNLGVAKHTVYTCDFTHDYIDINADYQRN